MDSTGRRQLYKAALRNDWTSAEKIFQSVPLTTGITPKQETALHIAVGTGHSDEFARKLVAAMSEEELEHRDTNIRSTALHLAAIVGNIKSVRMLVQKNPRLPQIANDDNVLPIHDAAQRGHKETVFYLLACTENVDPGLFDGQHGAHLLNLLIFADLYGIALMLLNDHPAIASQRDRTNNTALEILSRKPQAFPSGCQLGFIKQLIYRYIGDDIHQKCLKEHKEQLANLQKELKGGSLHTKQETCSGSVSYFGCVSETKLRHLQALELVKIICKETAQERNEGNLEDKLRRPALQAAELGIVEIVIRIIKAHPYTIWLTDGHNHNVIYLAVENRQEKVYNLLYQIDLQRFFATGCLQEHGTGNTMLHLAAKLNPSTRISGAALQMQRELQWYKEVEKVTEPPSREMKNADGETPRQKFTREHKELVKEGEKWMKGLAQSFSVVAALIVTIVFAAAFTVPGGNNNDTGVPVFLGRSSFTVFAVADALALFTSTTAVFMFLAILTSRYAEDDFLRSLPMKLSIGLITLFISITSMVIAFTASLYIVVDHRPIFLIPMIVAAIISSTSFAWLHYPLLVQVVTSTFGRNMFGPQSEELLYGWQDDDVEEGRSGRSQQAASSLTSTY